MNTAWNITFTNPDGETRTTEILWTDTPPTMNEAAVAIRDRLLGDVVFPVDRPRESSNHTIHLLEHHGYKIIGVERA